MDDAAFLREYAELRSDEAFAGLVTRHINLVYSVALRCVGTSHEAEDITQAVFILLAKKAPQLRHEKALSSWLFQATRLTANNFIRSETRRHHREQEAHMQSVLNESGSDLWPRIAPLLDDAVADLGESDRHAIMLRYYEGRSLREVAQALDASEDAAEKRVSRAVDKLRTFFARRGVTVSAGGLVLVISANAVQSAPVGLAATVSAAAVLAGGAAVSTSTALTVAKAITMTTLQKVLVTATVTVLAGAGIYEARQVSRLSDQNESLRQQQAPLQEQLQQAQHERNDATNRLAALQGANAELKQNAADLLKLRGQATQAQANVRELSQLKSKLASQSGKLPDYMTNAIALGVGVAQKAVLKEAMAKLERMRKGLNLTDDQSQAISDVIKTHTQARTQMSMDLLGGGLTLEKQQAMAAEKNAEEADIKSLLTPEQLAAYPAFQQAEKDFAAQNSAANDASRIATDFSLTPQQQEQIRAAFYQMNSDPQNAQRSSALAAAAKGGGNLADLLDQSVEFEKSQLEQKLQILGGILSPDQLNSYKSEQMNQIELMSSAMKMFAPPTNAGAQN